MGTTVRTAGGAGGSTLFRARHSNDALGTVATNLLISRYDRADHHAS